MICLPQKRQQLQAATASQAAVLPIVKTLALASAEQGEADTKACQPCESFEKGLDKREPPVSGAVQPPEGLAGVLDAFRANPKAYAAGTNMASAGGRTPARRASIIGFLHGLIDRSALLAAK